MIDCCAEYLDFFCSQIGERPVGSPGNRLAADRFTGIVKSFGWQVESSSFSALDWEQDGAACSSPSRSYEVFPAPYSLPCSLTAPLLKAGTFHELEETNCQGKILLVYGELAREQLMPKNFVFYNPEEHQRTIAALERKKPAAILAATSRNAALAGGVYPFPLIEDGDFLIPSLYLTEEEGSRLLEEQGQEISLVSRSRRIVAESSSLTAWKGHDRTRRIAISAHLDAKKGTPGALDNAGGVIVLLLLAQLLADYAGSPVIELLPFNGEDYYNAPGQMLYLERNQGRWHEIMLNINIDGAGYREGLTAFSPFDLPPDVRLLLDQLMVEFPGIVEGVPWYQGDHSVFLQQGVPAIAVTSQWFLENLDTQEITHTAADHPGIIDCSRLVEISRAIALMIQKIGGKIDG